MTTRSVTPEEHARIAEAIRAAEEKTAGEIYCVVARASDSYFFPAAAAVAVAMLLAGLGVAFALESWWLSPRLPLFAGAELLALAAALALLYAFPLLRIRLVPRRWQYSHAHDNALKQFLARNVHITTERTGVLIFVSLAERYAEIVADAGINSRVPQSVWDKVVAQLIENARHDRLADGFVTAVKTVGGLLAAEFPVRAANANELDDHLVEI
jgi:putative membrane protein